MGSIPGSGRPPGEGNGYPLQYYCLKKPHGQSSPVVLVIVQSLGCVWLFVTPWTPALQAFLSFTISQNLLKLMSLEAVMPSNHLILCHHLLLPPSLFPSIRVFSNESALHIRWLKYWSFSLSISPSNEYSGLLPLGLMVGSPCIPRKSQVSSPISQLESIKKPSGLASQKGSQRVRQDWAVQHKHMGRWILPWSTDPYKQKAPDFVNDSSWAEGVSIHCYYVPSWLWCIGTHYVWRVVIHFSCGPFILSSPFMWWGIAIRGLPGHNWFLWESDFGCPQCCPHSCCCVSDSLTGYTGGWQVNDRTHCWESLPVVCTPHLCMLYFCSS